MSDKASTSQLRLQADHRRSQISLEQALTIYNTIIDRGARLKMDFRARAGLLTGIDPDLAVEDYTTVIQMGSPDPRDFADRGIARLRCRNRDVEAAIRDFSQSILMQPTLRQFWALRARAYRMKDDFESAVSDFSKCLELEPEPYEHVDRVNSVTLTQRGRAYRSLDQPDLALADFARAIELNPTDPSTYNLQGNVYRDRHQYELALESYTAGMRQQPGDLWCRSNRAFTFICFRQFEEALEECEKCTEDMISGAYKIIRAVFFWRRAFCHCHLGNFSEASGDLDLSYQLFPNFAGLRRNMLALESLRPEFLAFLPQIAASEAREALRLVLEESREPSTS